MARLSGRGPCVHGTVPIQLRSAAAERSAQEVRSAAQAEFDGGGASERCCKRGQTSGKKRVHTSSNALLRLTDTALKQAEKARRWRQRRWEEDGEDGSDGQEEDEDEQEEAEEEYDYGNGPEEDEENEDGNLQDDDGESDPSDDRWETAVNQQLAREEFPSSEDEEEELVATPAPKEAGSFSIPSEQRHMMNEVIDAYQARKQDDARVNTSARAASRIARRYRIHRQDQHLRRNASRIIVDSLHRNVTTRRSHRSRELQQRRQEKAAQLIQLWVRRRLIADRQRERLESRQRREEDVAVRRLQHCARRLLLRNALRKREQREREEQTQAAVDQQDDSEPIEPSNNEEAEQEDQNRIELQRQQELIEQEHKKKVMKKEAMDLIKILVNKQLETRLRDHDAKMLELQQLVTTLQDVVRTQSAMIRQSSDTILELEQAAAGVAAAERSPQTIQRSNSIRSLKQKPMASQLPGPPPPANSSATSLPVLTRPQVVRTGSGIKAPRSIDIPSKLPAVTPAHVRPNPTRPRVRN